MGSTLSRSGAVATCLTLLVLLAGCGDNDKKGMGDAPVLGRQGDDTPAEVFNFPDHFGNLATKCVGHGYRAYVTTNNGDPSNIEIVPDSRCATSGATASQPQPQPTSAGAVPSPGSPSASADGAGDG